MNNVISLIFLLLAFSVFGFQNYPFILRKFNNLKSQRLFNTEESKSSHFHSKKSFPEIGLSAKVMGGVLNSLELGAQKKLSFIYNFF